MRIGLWFTIATLGVAGTIPALAQPINDDCANASLAPLAIGTNPYDTSGAITDGTQTFCFLWNDAWFVFTPPITGSYILATCGSSYDTIIQVFDGTLCPDDLNISLACNDDGCSLQSSVTVALTGGVDHLVRLGSFDPAITGPATLEITSLASLPNDECVDALPATLGMNPLDTAGATDSADPYDDLTCPGTVLGQMSNDLWYTYTPGAAAIRVSTCSLAGDTDIVVYQGGVCGALTQVGCDGDAPGCTGFSSIAVAPVTPGIECVIRIGSFTPGATQNGQFLLSEAAPEVCTDGIDNDLDGLLDCADAIDCGALAQCDESLNCTDALDNDVDGNTDCADPDCAGVFPCPAAIAGDECLTALSAGIGPNPYDTLFALDSPEPFSCPSGSSPGVMAKDVWWTFTASASALHRAENCSVPHDSDLAVYAGSCGALIPVDCSGDTCGLASRVEWSAVAGTTYTIRLGSYSPSSFGAGDLVVIEGGPENCGDGIDNDFDGAVDCADVSDCPIGVAPCVPPANDSCATPTPLLLGANPYDTALASDSPEPDSGCPSDFAFGAMALDIWWSWTAATSGLHRVSTCGTSHDSSLEVYEAAVASCDTSVPVGCSGDSCGPASQVDWIATAGTVYTVRLGSGGAGGGAIGTLTLEIGAPENCSDSLDNDLDGFADCLDGECACTAACPPPLPGDECCSALPAVTGVNAFSTIGLATSSDAYDAAPCAFTSFGSLEHDIWLSWTASMDGDATWDTCDAVSFDTDVVIYAGSSCASLAQVACNGDGTGAAGCQFGASSGQFPIAAGSTYLFRIGGWSSGVAGDGTLTIVESCAPPVTGLAATADCVGGDVTLSWDPAGFSSYDIARGGVVIATALPAGTTGAVDLSAPNGTHEYDVIGHCASGGDATTSILVTVATFTGQQDLIVRGELATGQTDSVAALATELTLLGRTYLIWDGGIGGYPCNDAPFEIIWQMNGTFPDFRCLDADDALALAAARLAGAGIYTECGDQWGYCAGGTVFDDFDGVGGATDGDDTFLGMDGFDSGLGLDLSDEQDIIYMQDQALNDWTDRLTVAAGDPGLAAASAIWALDDALGAPYITGVHGVGATTGGAVISQSWEFGGFGGDRIVLAGSYVAALRGGDPVLFRRGDCNADGLRNIADAVYGLGALFPPVGGTANDPPCDDACDANDDGAMNIADMVTILGSLFPPGGGPPTVIPPPFGGCGPDPTTDTIDCFAFPNCP